MADRNVGTGLSDVDLSEVKKADGNPTYTSLEAATPANVLAQTNNHGLSRSKSAAWAVLALLGTGGAGLGSYLAFWRDGALSEAAYTTKKPYGENLLKKIEVEAIQAGGIAGMYALSTACVSKALATYPSQRNMNRMGAQAVRQDQEPALPTVTGWTVAGKAVKTAGWAAASAGCAVAGVMLGVNANSSGYFNAGSEFEASAVTGGLGVYGFFATAAAVNATKAAAELKAARRAYTLGAPSTLGDVEAQRETPNIR